MPSPSSKTRPIHICDLQYLHLTECIGCLKNHEYIPDPDSGEQAGFYCIVMNVRYFERKLKTCQAKIVEKIDLLRELQAMEQYAMKKSGHVPPELRAEIMRTRKSVVREGGTAAGWEQVMRADTKRGKGGGGGEKADRTNKAFGPARMKDNRLKSPWTEADSRRIFGRREEGE